MRWALGFSACLLVAVAAILVQQSSARNESPGAKSKSDSFVVHEWGTFTSFSGSDGVKLEFRPLVENDLPPFILNRATQSGLRNPFGKVNMSVLQRMETPVTYFYTDQPRQVSVRVGFPQGLLTEFYPPVDKMLPAYDPRVTEPLTNSALDWGTIWLIPEDNFQVQHTDAKLAGELQANALKRMLPTVHWGHPYEHARETDSAIIYKKPSFEKGSPFPIPGGFLEKFLFYRGVGNFALPLELTAQAGDRFELSNNGEQPIRALFLVTVKSEQIWFKQYAEILPKQKLTLSQSDGAGNLEDLANAVEAALVAEGLYSKEAKAMVNTWRYSWFGEEGTRLFYVLPQSETEKLLPLEIKPTPQEVLRVMVGRLEIMRPEDEQQVMAVVRESLRSRPKKINTDEPQPASIHSASKAADEPRELPPLLLSLGRLAEPALVRVQSIATDANMKAEATLLLEELRDYRNREADSKL